MYRPDRNHFVVDMMPDTLAGQPDVSLAPSFGMVSPKR
jgi:hypothetical protein